jgi:hypothetical protein
VTRILLDLDDTVLLNGGLHPRFPEFRAWVERGGHAVTVWSSRDDGGAIASLMGFGHLHKDAPGRPEADILIDDCGEQFSALCSVAEVYDSLGGFLDAVSG